MDDEQASVQSYLRYTQPQKNSQIMDNSSGSASISGRFHHYHHQYYHEDEDEDNDEVEDEAMQVGSRDHTHSIVARLQFMLQHLPAEYRDSLVENLTAAGVLLSNYDPGTGNVNSNTVDSAATISINQQMLAMFGDEDDDNEDGSDDENVSESESGSEEYFEPLQQPLEPGSRSTGIEGEYQNELLQYQLRLNQYTNRLSSATATAAPTATTAEFMEEAESESDNETV